MDRDMIVVRSTQMTEYTYSAQNSAWNVVSTYIYKINIINQMSILILSKS